MPAVADDVAALSSAGWRPAGRSARTRSWSPAPATPWPGGSPVAGKLVVFGSGAAATDAQHLAVEFVHPVIVGKRAFPALSLAGTWRR